MDGNPVYTIIISSKAQREMAASWLWYEEREEGLGDRLYAAVMQKLNIIAKNSDLFSIKHNPYREAKVSIFPFVIVYKIHKKKKLIEAVSVFHTSRNPKRKY
jgi:hypothetical protein